MATERIYKFAVWATQGGGLVRRVGDHYFFVEKPHQCVGLDVGDDLPESWGLMPANRLAEEEMAHCRNDDSDFERAMQRVAHFALQKA
jgi:hypothetical protein